ncbi:MAG TPA: SDR family NAD(P)-dependent oxidoreductase [Methylomirabilota bacterium]|jgi:3-oxoacyl-[acyl-carrier protein] reductase|nr:SDR family NAD(P)-dependent oxidoreductase [Methylomirabilota bacterium]
MKLRDRVTIVTGAAKGMGEAIVRRLAGEGADLVLAAREAPPLEVVAAEVRALGRRALVVPTDVRDEASVRALVEATVDTFGRVDVLVNCAGTTGPIETPVHQIKLEDWDEVLAVNLRGTFLPTKHVVPVMLRQGGGKIVNIAGTSGLRGYKLRAAYSSSKWAVRGFTRTVALEVGPHGITVNCVAPGIVGGPRMDRLCREKARKRGWTPEQVYAEYVQEMALRRVTTADDVANAVCFLCTDESRNMTGQCLTVDGGWDV